MHRQQKWQDEMRRRHRCIQCGSRCRKRGKDHRGAPISGPLFWVRCEACRLARRNSKSYRAGLRPKPAQVALNKLDADWRADAPRRKVREGTKALIDALRRRPNGTQSKQQPPLIGADQW